MTTHKSQISRAEDRALDLSLRLTRAAARGGVSPEELARCAAEARHVHHAVRAAHRDQRRGISILRTGVEAPQIVRDFGPIDIDVDPDYLGVE